jgi:hypothetical protein
MGRRRPRLRQTHAARVAPPPPRARIVSRADVGHYPQLEDPAWVAANLRHFL